MSRYLKKKERNIFLRNSSKNVTFTAIHYVTGRDAGRQALPSASTLLPLYRFFLKYDYRAVSPHWSLTLANIWARSVAFASQQPSSSRCTSLCCIIIQYQFSPDHFDIDTESSDFTFYSFNSQLPLYYPDNLSTCQQITVNENTKIGKKYFDHFVVFVLAY